MQANKFRIIQEVYKVKTFGTTQVGSNSVSPKYV